MSGNQHSDLSEKEWPGEIHRLLREAGTSQVPYVPDAGHKALIDLCHDDPTMTAIPLTTEEEGVALLAGAWLGGARGALLMQSSGVGNCINMLSLTASGRFPLVMLVTMRGEWEEFNPWQVPMSRAIREVLGAMGVSCLRAETPEEVGPKVAEALDLAYGNNQAVAVLLAQKLIGKKVW